jgi:hypothetical protein
VEADEEALLRLFEEVLVVVPLLRVVLPVLVFTVR